ASDYREFHTTAAGIPGALPNTLRRAERLAEGARRRAPDEFCVSSAAGWFHHRSRVRAGAGRAAVDNNPGLHYRSVAVTGTAPFRELILVAPIRLDSRLGRNSRQLL